MSYAHKESTSNTLVEQLKLHLRLRDDEVSALVEALDDYVDARVDDQIDRLFNRGDYRG
jgi:hypothetical protein